MKNNSLQLTASSLSIVLHVLFLIIFILLYKQSDLETELVEITFGEPGGGSGGYGEVISDNKQKVIVPEKSESEKENNDPGIEEISDKVEDKISSSDKIAESKKEDSKKVETASHGTGNNPEGFGNGNGFGPGSGDGNGSGNGMGDGIGDGYSLSFGGRVRKIYDYEIPNYPAGIQKNIDIKLRFTILPDGTVGTVFPLIKADAQLEKTAINSLKKWRFEPIVNSKSIQTAIITFPFRVD